MKIRTCLAAVAAVALTACAPAPSQPGTVTPDPGPTTNPSAPTPDASPSSVGPAPTPGGGEVTECASLASELSLEARVGQLYMVGVSTSGLDGATRTAILDNQVGSAVLLGNSTAGADPIVDITEALAALELEVPIAVAVDQEGGSVQRLSGEGFSQIPSALEQSRLTAGELERAARQWGEELSAVGVGWNLAPVADYVPADKQETNGPIGALRRNYGTDIDVTTRAVREYVEGMQIAGVATSLKHFPGLGFVDDNTDFDTATDTDILPHDERWEPFLAGMSAGASSVMVSSATFTNLDPEQEAVFSSAVITDILRDELGYQGIVIADDLGAAAAVADVPPAERGLRFIEAGGDVVINADPDLMTAMVDATLERARNDPDFDRRITASATRVMELKSWLGLVSCAA